MLSSFSVLKFISVLKIKCNLCFHPLKILSLMSAFPRTVYFLFYSCFAVARWTWCSHVTCTHPRHPHLLPHSTPIPTPMPPAMVTTHTSPPSLQSPHTPSFADSLSFFQKWWQLEFNWSLLPPLPPHMTFYILKCCWKKKFSLEFHVWAGR